MIKRFSLLLPALLLAIALTGCATQGSTQGQTARNSQDPFESVNRATYAFNTVADKAVLRPLASGYSRFVPRFLRIGIDNFFTNLQQPRNIVNSVLQGKFRRGTQSTARLLFNSTVGVAGLFDPATSVGIPLHAEDFGQTLEIWGVPEGPYIVVPLLGPFTVSSGAGTLVDWSYHPRRLYDDSSIRDKMNLFWFVYARSKLLSFDEEIDNAFDSYSFVRDAYLQNRDYVRYDGVLPTGDLFDESDLDDFDEFDE